MAIFFSAGMPRRAHVDNARVAGCSGVSDLSFSEVSHSENFCSMISGISSSNKAILPSGPLEIVDCLPNLTLLSCLIKLPICPKGEIPPGGASVSLTIVACFLNPEDFLGLSVFPLTGVATVFCDWLSPSELSPNENFSSSASEIFSSGFLHLFNLAKVPSLANLTLLSCRTKVLSLSMGLPLSCGDGPFAVDCLKNAELLLVCVFFLSYEGFSFLDWPNCRVEFLCIGASSLSFLLGITKVLCLV